MRGSFLASSDFALNRLRAGTIFVLDWLCRGNPETQKAIWFNLQNGVLIGAVTLNQGREIRPIRKWIQSGKTFDAKLLIDENIALKSL